MNEGVHRITWLSWVEILIFRLTAFGSVKIGNNKKFRINILVINKISRTTECSKVLRRNNVEIGEIWFSTIFFQMKILIYPHQILDLHG